jgi:PilZ domain-containing protein
MVHSLEKANWRAILTKPLGDRRARVRFEVLGTLRGTLELTESARVVNISAQGALIESATKVALDSLHEFQLTLDGHLARVAARVCRLEQVSGQGGSPLYLIGLEFLSPPSVLADSIRMLAGEV